MLEENVDLLTSPHSRIKGGRMSDEEVTLEPNIIAETTSAEVMEAYIGERLKSFFGRHRMKPEEYDKR
jgi:hypothetical protein